MEPYERLAAARKAKKLTLAKLAELVGTSNQQIDKLEKGTRTLTKEWAEKIAPALGMTAQFMLFGTQEDDNTVKWKTIPVTTLKLVGYVEAGAWRDISTSEPPEREVAVPRDERFPRAGQFCLQVRGDSMNDARPIPIIAGAILRCVDFYESGLELSTGQIAVVQRTRDGGHLIETTVKRVSILPDRIELRPESTNPAHLPIIWNEESERTGETRVIAIVTAIVNEI